MDAFSKPRHSLGVPRIGISILAALIVCEARPAASAPDATEAEADDAVSLASNAFEYRDFKKVIAVITPWLHPPRITKRDQRIRARELLGVSLHVQGDVAAAREEFTQLLVEDPLHKLDPFVIAPPVIETFEALRREMKPTLDRILKERGQKADPDPDPNVVKVKVVPVTPSIVAFLPFGIPQFQLSEYAVGVTFLVLQVLGIVVNTVGYFRARSLARDRGDDTGWLIAQYAGLGTFAASWAVSILVASGELADYNRALLKEAPKIPPPAPGGVLTFRF